MGFLIGLDWIGMQPRTGQWGQGLLRNPWKGGYCIGRHIDDMGLERFLRGQRERERESRVERIKEVG